MTEDGPYGNFGGDPWTDLGTFMEIYAVDHINGIRARYNTILLQLLVSTWILELL